MKRTISLFLVLVLCLSLCACGGNIKDNLDMTSSYMISDNNVSVTFTNNSKSTITSLEGKLNLFAGSTSGQTPIATPRFSWTGTCEPGEKINITVSVSSSYSGMSSDVNRIGCYISSVNGN